MAQCLIYEEDEVGMLTSHGYKCGLVIESSEYVSSDDEDDDDLNMGSLQKGSVRVAWHPSGREEIVPEKKLKLVDRSLMPGDIVRRMSAGKKSQMGLVRKTTVTCHVQVLNKTKVIRGISSKDLAPVTSWNPDPNDVTLDCWIGKVETISDEITLKFKDGARCRVSEKGGDIFAYEDIHDSRDKDSEFSISDYYPGQMLRGPIGDLEDAEWLHSTKNHARTVAEKHPSTNVTVTVEKVDPGYLDVHWLCRGFAVTEDPTAKTDQPPRRLLPEHIKRLKKLDCFEASSVQLGDKAFYTLEESDMVENIKPSGSKPLVHYLVKASTEEEEVDSLNAKNSQISAGDAVADEAGGAERGSGDDGSVSAAPSAAPDSAGDGSKCTGGIGDKTDEAGDTADPNCPAVNIILDTEAGEDDVDTGEDARDDDEEYEEEESDDGSVASAHSRSSQPSTPKKIRARRGGLPIKLMKKKRGKKTKKPVEKDLMPGDRVPVEVIYTFTEVEVMWQDTSIEEGISSTDLLPIHYMDDFELFPTGFVLPAGDTVKDDRYGVVEKVDHAGRTCVVRWMTPYEVGKANKPDICIDSEEVSVYDVRDHPDYKFRHGEIVVRIAGSEGDASEAAGQVYDTCLDGSLIIQWAGGKRSKAYPQELYLLGSDQMSELNDSGGESSDSDECSDASWETEEEEEQEDGETAVEEEVQSEEVSALDWTAAAILVTEVETAVPLLQKLQEAFTVMQQNNFSMIHHYKGLVCMYKKYRKLDALLGTRRFECPELKEVIASMKAQIKSEKAAGLTKHISGLIKSASSCVSQASEKHVESTDGKVSEGGKTETAPAEGAATAAATAGTTPAEKPESEHQASNLVGILDEVLLRFQDLSAMLTDVAKTCSVITPSNSVKSSDTNTSATESDASSSSPAGATAAVDQQTSPASSSLTNSSSKEAVDTVTKMISQSQSHQKDSAAASRNADKTADSQGALGATAAPPSGESENLCYLACKHMEAQLKNCLVDLKKRSAGPDSGNQTSAEPPANEDAEAENTSTARNDVASDTASQQDEKPSTAGSEGTSESDSRSMELSLPLPEALTGTLLVSPQSPVVDERIEFNKDGFVILESVSASHHFARNTHQPADRKSFHTALRKELKLLKTSLPKGIYVKGYEERMDLFSVMIQGPSRTPYEDGLFFFEVQLPGNYPSEPPTVHYIAYCSDRLNPNLYEDGKVCVSLLGTWSGKGTEVWTNKSTMLQVLISIQGLILVGEPYYNEAGFERQKGSAQGQQNSRMYNEMAILKLVQSMIKIVKNPPSVFEVEVVSHLQTHAYRMIKRLDSWLQISEAALRSVSSGSTAGEGASAMSENSSDSSDQVAALCTGSAGPDFPLLPASKGFCITLRKHLAQLRTTVESAGISDCAV